MEYLQFLERPELDRPSCIVSFIGWADAQEGASRAIRYLVESLPAKKFAQLDPEEFYDFTLVRPTVHNSAEGQRVLRWPSNEFFYWRSPDGSKELVLFLGTEPNLKWRTYTSALLSVLEPYDLQQVISLGSLLDAVPHTRETTLSGGANKEELKARLEGLRIMASNYQGPVGITSAFMDACTKADLNYLSIWGHAPHYVQRSPNYNVAKALVGQVSQVFGLELPLDELERKGQAFEAEVTKAISSSVEVSAYVKRLEREHDEALSRREEGLPPPEAVIEDVERFLRQDRPGSEPFSPN